MRLCKKLHLAFALGVCALGATALSDPAFAQTVKDGTQKTHFYNAPHEIQIIDERPVVRDFREAPSAPQAIQLPPPPQGFAGGGGGGGAGALAGGNAGTMPGDGNIGGPNQGYRTASNPMGALPKSGFQGSNIPARGMGPRGNLAPGTSTGVVGNMLNKGKGQGSGAGPARGMAPSAGRTNGNSSAPVASYSGGYGSGAGSAYGGSASRTDTLVRGSLLRK